jgi:hypothetical protein
MQLPNEVYETLVEICEAYPWPVVQEDFHIGEILNAVAWRHKQDGWGLSRKTGGKHIDSPVGPIAEDILQLPDGNHFDVLGGIDVGQPLRPGRASSIGIINLRGRPWVAPKDHNITWWGATNPPKDEPPVTEKPETKCEFKPCECKCSNTEVLEAIQSLRDRIDELATHFDGIGATQIEQLDRIEAKPTGSCKLRF